MSQKTEPKIMLALKEIVNPDHTALVVWDVQNLLVDRIFNPGSFLNGLKAIISAARAVQIPVVFSKITPLPEAYASPFRTFMFMRRFGIDDPQKLPRFMQPGSRDAEIHADVLPLETDPVFDKHTASMFVGTHFEAMMRNRGIKTLVFTGISTEIGIASSARDSANRGFYTIVAADAVSSTHQAHHEACLEILKSVCLVEPVAQISKHWA